MTPNIRPVKLLPCRSPCGQHRLDLLVSKLQPHENKRCLCANPMSHNEAVPYPHRRPASDQLPRFSSHAHLISPFTSSSPHPFSPHLTQPLLRPLIHRSIIPLVFALDSFLKLPNTFPFPCHSVCNTFLSSPYILI